MTFDRPPREDYVRVSVARSGLSFEPAIEHRRGDDFELLAEQLEAIVHVVTVLHEHHPATAMDAARLFAGEAEARWPDRAYFVEVWKEGERGFAQIFQPFGIPRNR